MKQLAWIGLAAIWVGCAGASAIPGTTTITISVEKRAAVVVALSAREAEAAAAVQLSMIQTERQARLLPKAQLAARSIVVGADGAALNVEGVDCLQWLAAQNASFEIVTDYTPERPARSREACTIDQPVRLDGQVGSVRFSHDHMLMSCELARSMVRFAGVLESYDVAEVDIGTPFSCRTMRRRRRISQHAHGNALDVGAIRTSSGQEFPIEDWERRDETPDTAGGRLWYDIARRLHEEEVFHIILTPDYDRAHAHWLHLDLTPGQHSIR